jgi:hypothetical protein
VTAVVAAIGASVLGTPVLVRLVVGTVVDPLGLTRAQLAALHPLVQPPVQAIVALVRAAGLGARVPVLVRAMRLVVRDLSGSLARALVGDPTPIGVALAVRCGISRSE